MTVAEQVRSARRRVFMSQSDVACAAGIAKSTVSRIEAGVLDPTVAVYESILGACGVLTAPSVRELDPATAVAARFLLDPALDAEDAPEGVARKIAAMRRLGWVDDGGDIALPLTGFLSRVGLLAGISRRPGVRVVDGAVGTAEMIRRLADGGIDYAVSGPDALVRLGADAANMAPVIYVEDTYRAKAALGVGDFVPMSGQIPATLIPFDGWSERGRSDGFVTPIQAIIDGFCGSSRMPDMAEQAIERWEGDRS